MFSCCPAGGKGSVAKRRQERGKQCTASSLEAWVLAGAVWSELGTVARRSTWSTCLALAGKSEVRSKAEALWEPQCSWKQICFTIGQPTFLLQAAASCAACVSGSALRCSSPWLGTTQRVFSKRSLSRAGVFTLFLFKALSAFPLLFLLQTPISSSCPFLHQACYLQSSSGTNLEGIDANLTSSFSLSLFVLFCISMF